MSESANQHASTSNNGGAKAERPRNPALKAMGIPNWRLRLPSRNWSIFLTITGSFAAAWTYDRRQQKAVQKKWCDMVAHVAQDTLPVNQTPRKLTVFISAPPGDSMRPSRDYFRQYIKPVLVAAAIDYDVIEGRREGEVRYGTAEQIRRLRRKRGETSKQQEEPDVETAIETVREKMQIKEEPGIKGDLVLGRHTWKEYVRGLHEGWLGPIDAPEPPSPEKETPETPPTAVDGTQADEQKPEEKKPEEPAKPPPKTPIPFILTTSYPLSDPAPTMPSSFEPSLPLYQQHLLGFLKTPQRIYNFLNRRHLQDQLGRETAAIVLAANRPYHQSENLVSDLSDTDGLPPVATLAPESDQQSPTQQSPQLSISDPASRATLQTASHWEQQTILGIEEATWHKSMRKPKTVDDGTAESVWRDSVVLDPRIAQRMRKFELAPEEDERAARIGAGQETGKARVIEDLRSKPVIVGNVDEEL